MEYLSRFATALFSSLGESAPYLVIGYLLVALIREYVPRPVLVHYLGGSGPWPVANALGIGSLLPVCSCGSIPLGVGLERSGAARGTTLTFMTSSPAISPVSVILGYTLLGPPLLLAYVATVVVGAFLIGIVGNQLLRDRPPEVDADPAACDDDCCERADNAGHGGRLRAAVRWAYWDLGSEVSVDLLIGLMIAAGVTAFLPPEWITAWLGQDDVRTLLYIVLISIPVYTCSVPSLLVVNSLLVAGASPGAAVAFLVAGPASNLGEVNAIRGAMGRRTAAYYVVSLIVMAVVGGMVTNRLLPASYRVAGHAANSDVQGAAVEESGMHLSGGFGTLVQSVPAWHYPFIVVLAVVLLLGLARRVRQLWRR